MNLLLILLSTVSYISTSSFQLKETDHETKQQDNVNVNEHGYCLSSSSTDCTSSADKNKLSSIHGQRIQEHATGFSGWQFSPVSLLQQLPLDDDRINVVRQVRHAVFSFVNPTPFKLKCRLVAVSSALEDLLDINPDSVWTDDFTDFAAGNAVKPGSHPLAHRYGGHQFGNWAGQLGDGRAVILGEFVNSRGERWELQLKGSGKTPYSRHGDGRAVIRSSVREFLASEAMYHLHVPTSRAGSIVICDDLIIRDQFYDGHPRQEKTAVVLRLAQSWFRIGSLEILSSTRELEILRQVVDFLIDTSFPQLKELNEHDRYLGFFQTVVNETAEMIARWMSVGFAHGICNTDNFSLLSITIDYGPFGFMDQYNSDFIPNTSDDEGLYRFENQPQVGLFNLDKLRTAMDSLFIDKDKSTDILGTYEAVFQQKYMDIMRQKLGLTGIPDDYVDERLLGRLFELLEITQADFTMTFRELSEISLDDLLNDHFPEEFWALPHISAHEDWHHWVEVYVNRSQNGNVSEYDRKQIMQAANPRYILRNYMAQQAIENAENSYDFSEINSLLKTLERPFERQVSMTMI